MTKIAFFATLRAGVIAGAAGGLAEAAWVVLYSAATGGDPSIVASGVTTAAGMGALLPLSAATFGVALHMILAVGLGVALAFTWRAVSARRAGPVNPYTLTLAALGCVWAVNFFVLLPIIDPAFIQVVSYPVSLTSKLLFGLAAAEVLRQQIASVMNPRQASVVQRAA